MTTTKPHVLIGVTPVAPGTAYWLLQAAAEFKEKTGYDIEMSTAVTFQGKSYPLGGLRTKADQTLLYNAYLAGTYPYLVGSPTDPTVSRHLDSVGAAVDVQDNGPTPGIDTIGSDRHNLWTGIAKKYGFAWTGNTFSPKESWHYELIGHDPWTVPVEASLPTTLSTDEEDYMNETLVLISTPTNLQTGATQTTYYIIDVRNHTYYRVTNTTQLAFLKAIGYKARENQAPQILDGFKAVD